MRALSLGSILSRQIAECFTPLVERCANMEFRSGRFGVFKGTAQEQAIINSGKTPLIIPDALKPYVGSKDKIYRVRYKTPAARLLDSEQVNGILQTWEFAQKMAATNPEVIDKLDPDFAIEAFGRGSGAPERAFRPKKSLEERIGFEDIRDQRAQQQNQQMQMQQAEQAANAAKVATDIAEF
jgi:hypothetical protein